MAVEHVEVVAAVFVHFDQQLSEVVIFLVGGNTFGDWDRDWLYVDTVAEFNDHLLDLIERDLAPNFFSDSFEDFDVDVKLNSFFLVFSSLYGLIDPRPVFDFFGFCVVLLESE